MDAIKRGTIEVYSQVARESVMDNFLRITPHLAIWKQQVSTDSTEALKQLLHPASERSQRLLVFPGGEGSKWDDHLSAEDRFTIQQMVHDGEANLMGVCAGAYYWSRGVQFSTSDQSINKTRPASLFPGYAIGPIGGRFRFHANFSYARSEALAPAPGIPPCDTAHFYGLVNGGGYFEADPWPENWDVLLNYLAPGQPHHGKPAVILGRCGKGRVLLSMVHFEYSSEHLPMHLPGSDEIDIQLRWTIDARHQFIDYFRQQLR